MKPVYVILGIPLLAFLALTITLDLATLLAWYPDFDKTPYLAARSIGNDHDLSYTRVDSDRFFLETQQRPSHFYLVQKKGMTSTGAYHSWNVFYSPDLYVFLLAPFAALLGIRGILLLHCLLLGGLYTIGYLYYSISNEENLLPALNAAFYY